MGHEAVVLVPGLFGFGSFGAGDNQIRYFDHVVANLARFAGIDERRIVVHEPGPAEPLAWRVRSLHACVTRVLGGEVPAVGPVDRLHLIGHSTGGVDARLLMNERYAWPDAPRGAARTDFFSRIGAVVSLSGPHWGSPMARRLRGAQENVLPELYLASILAKHNRFAWAESLLLSLFRFGRPSAESPSPRLLKAMAALPASVSSEVSRFLTRIVDDHALIHDLAPLAMERLNRAVAPGEWPRVRYYVTAAARGTLAKVLWRSLRGEALRSASFAWADHLSRPSENERRPFPRGAWVGVPGSRPPPREVETTDGAVPAGSQVLGGDAAGIVHGDHLDVIGHYASKRFQATSLFRSGSDFDDGRFDELWRTIASDLATP